MLLSSCTIIVIIVIIAVVDDVDDVVPASNVVAIDVEDADFVFD